MEEVRQIKFTSSNGNFRSQSPNPLPPIQNEQADNIQKNTNRSGSNNKIQKDFFEKTENNQIAGVAGAALSKNNSGVNPAAILSKYNMNHEMLINIEKHMDTEWKQTKEPRITNLKDFEKELRQTKQTVFNLSKIHLKRGPGTTRLLRGYSEQRFEEKGGKKYKKLDQTDIQKESYKDDDEIIKILNEGLNGILKEHGKYPKQMVYEVLPVHIREFYSSKKDFLKIFGEYDTMNFSMNMAIEQVRCYRYEMGNAMDKILKAIYTIFERLLDCTIRLQNETQKKFERQIKENLTAIERLEMEKKELEVAVRELKNRSIIQQSFVKLNQINSDALQKEIILLHELLKKDTLSAINHIGTIENSQIQNFTQGTQEDPSERLVTGLKDLNKFLSGIEREQDSQEGLLTNMNGVLKNMIKGVRQDAFTQVDQGELQWEPVTVVKHQPDISEPINQTDAEYKSVKVKPDTIGKDQVIQTTLDILQNEELNLNSSTAQKVPMGENWNLPLTLVVMLENVTKQKESGQVMPWLRFRNVIYEIYNDRIQNQWEISGSLITNCLGMDEYLCIYFLKQFKIRRMAETKLFEFLISLRYYQKQFRRAEYMAYLLEIAQITVPHGDAPSIYKSDIYFQNYYLECFRRIREKDFREFQNFSYVLRDKAVEVAKEQLSYLSQQKRTNCIQKIVKNTTKLANQQYIDVDLLIEYFIEEYFAAKKLLVKNLGKNYSKIYQVEHRIYSLDDLQNIAKEVLQQKSLIPNANHPSSINITRAFLYALTSTNNLFQVGSKEFLASCSRYGIDCPFPFIRNQLAIPDGAKIIFQDALGNVKTENVPSPLTIEDNMVNKSPDHRSDSISSVAAKTPQGGDKQSMAHGRASVVSKNNSISQKDDTHKPSLFDPQQNDATQKKEEPPPKKVEDNVISENKKIDVSSTLFAQHFSILRELRNYVKGFQDAYSKETDPETLWTQFGQISTVLDTGCQFLNFPISL